ncbi:MAG: glycosyltransferase family 4 protein, partial [Gammaproteobacteria bacterium]|nr:glycosyltransferase family 4 protein [Gammaproteobacteria bacterium]
MRILFFSDHFYPEPSAPAAHVYERAKIWVKAGHDVTVITNAPNTPIGRVYDGYSNAWRYVEEMDGIRVIRVKTYIAENKGNVRRIMDYISYAISAFINALFEKRPDVIISTSPHIFVPLVGCLIAILKRSPHVFEVRDLWPASIAAATNLDKGNLYRFLERLELALYKRATRIIAFTPAFVRDMTSRNVPADKIDLVINGADLNLFQPRPPDDTLRANLNLRSRFIVGYLGTIGLAHGLEHVIRVAEILIDEPVTFLFVGEGAKKEELRTMALEYGLDNVRFVSRQIKEEMPRYWSICNISLIHLKNDAVFQTVIPSKIFESMAMGMPILYVGPRGEGSRIIEERSAGLVVPAADPD